MVDAFSMYLYWTCNFSDMSGALNKLKKLHLAIMVPYNIILALIKLSVKAVNSKSRMDVRPPKTW